MSTVAQGVAPPDPAPLLLSGASPSDKVELAIDNEFDQIEQSVRLGSHRDHLRLVLSRDTEPAELIQKMLDESPSIVHFSGHGTQRSELHFENPDGTAMAVDLKTLKRMFAAFNGIVRCVVLNACYSAPQAEAIANDIDCVIGMSDRVSDAAAQMFASNFYRALASGRDVATCFDLAVVNIDLAGIPEGKTPALFGRERAAMLVFDGQQVDDLAVTTSIVEGIEQVARQLYDSEYLSLVRLASTVIDSVSVCEGIVQEAFVKLLTEGVDESVSGPSGVLGVLRKAVLDVAQGRRDLASELFPAQVRPHATAASDEVTKVLRSIQALASDESQALLIAQLTKMDPAATAAALGLTDDKAVELVKGALDKVGSLLEALA